MKNQLQTIFLLVFLLSLSGQAAFAQEEETTLPFEVAEEEVPADQEVEVNEDNYRQFMELKGANQQRDIIPEEAFKSGSGLQKLDKLPEESQKHLRNQLREIIVQGDPWQPGDEETQYPYTPSAAASTDPSLEKQELEAWGELVDSYHDRESQIYENSSGSQAARGSEQGSSNSPENGAGSQGNAGQDGEGSQGQQAAHEGPTAESESEGTYSLNGSSDPNANGTAGVSQNAMEFLQGLGKNGSDGGNQGTSTESGQHGESPTRPGDQSQAQTGQQGQSGQSSAASGTTPNPVQEPNASSTAGASQNAMEFLKGNTGQDNGQSKESPGQDNGQSQNSQQNDVAKESTPGSPSASSTLPSPAETEEEQTAGTSQNALEYLKGESDRASGDTDDEPVTNLSEDTLTIQDLLNAQGVGGSTEPEPIQAERDQQKETQSDKDDND